MTPIAGLLMDVEFPQIRFTTGSSDTRSRGNQLQDSIRRGLTLPRVLIGVRAAPVADSPRLYPPAIHPAACQAAIYSL